MTLEFAFAGQWNKREFKEGQTTVLVRRWGWLSDVPTKRQKRALGANSTQRAEQTRPDRNGSPCEINQGPMLKSARLTGKNAVAWSTEGAGATHLKG